MAGSGRRQNLLTENGTHGVAVSHKRARKRQRCVNLKRGGSTCDDTGLSRAVWPSGVTWKRAGPKPSRSPPRDVVGACP